MREPFLADTDVTLYHGDALDVLCEMPDESVDCCVTSPPYWGLRDYGTGAWEGGDERCDHVAPLGGGTQASGLKHPNNALTQETIDAKVERLRGQYRDTCGKCGATRIDQQLGLEPTPELYVERMVEVFREVRRVLAPHGTVWLNLGDSYNNRSVGRKSSHQGGLGFESDDLSKSWATLTQEGRTRLSIENGDMKEKDLVGIPWMVAFALRADGWYLRSDIIWAKPNPMPESVTDRPTKAHEYVFLLSKQPRYFFDQEAVREAWSENTHSKGTNSTIKSQVHEDGSTGVRNNQSWAVNTSYAPSAQRKVPQAETLDDSEGEAPRAPDGRRKTTVQGADGSLQHRDGERWPNGGRNIRSVWTIPTQPYPEAHFATFPEELARRCIAAGCPEDGTVLDPFVGSGTVCLVARKLGRQSIGIDLSAEYLELAARRLQQLALDPELLPS